VKSLVDGSLGVEGEAGIDLSRNLAGDDLEDLLAELNEEVVKGGVNLLIDGLALGLTLRNGSIDQAGILGLLGSSKDERGVGGGILRLILVNGGEVTGVANDNLIA
jgi:hypothetical protein